MILQNFQQDLRFSRFMTPESLWVVPVEKVWEPNTFSSSSSSTTPNHRTSASSTHRVFYDMDKMQLKQKKLNAKKKKAAQTQSVMEDCSENEEAAMIKAEHQTEDCSSHVEDEADEDENKDTDL